MDCLKEICEMKEQLLNAMKTQLSGNLNNVDTAEAGEVIDMIKDLAEAEYYCKITEAMEDVEDYPDDRRMGYNSKRSPRTGRYISSMGGNSSMGYNPVVEQKPYLDEYMRNPGEMKDRMRSKYGYRPMWLEDGNNYGSAFDEYRYAKRNYTETKSPSDKKEMDSKTQEHVHNSMYTLREMWSDADPELKKKMKSELETLIKEMTV